MSAGITLFFEIQMKWTLPPSYMVGESVSLHGTLRGLRHISANLCVSPFMELDQFLASSVHKRVQSQFS